MVMNTFRQAVVNPDWLLITHECNIHTSLLFPCLLSAVFSKHDNERVKTQKAGFSQSLTNLSLGRSR